MYVYMCTCMHVTIINEKEAISLEESEVEHMEGLREAKRKREII